MQRNRISAAQGATDRRCWKFPPGPLAARGCPAIRLLPRLKTSPSLYVQSEELHPPPRGQSFRRVPVHPWQPGRPGSLYFSCFSSSSSNAAREPGNFPPSIKEGENKLILASGCNACAVTGVSESDQELKQQQQKSRPVYSKTLLDFLLLICKYAGV